MVLMIGWFQVPNAVEEQAQQKLRLANAPKVQNRGIVQVQ
jgi:hypothetical protein